MPCLPLILCASLLQASAAAPTPALAETSAATSAATPASPPTARELLLGLTATPRLAGTQGSRTGAEFVARELRARGFEVEWDERSVLLSLPRRVEWQLYSTPGDPRPALERADSFNPDAIPTADVPLYSAWSGNGVAEGPLVDCSYGRRSDFEALRNAGVELKGAIALIRYGKAYRGIKVDLASQFGCAGVLLYSDASDDGAGKGKVWPQGPWKPGHEAQRGSISPMGRAPGDPSTPGWASPRPGEAGKRLAEADLAAALPTIPCLPIGADDAQLARLGLTPRAIGEEQPRAIGPGPARVRMSVNAPREYRTIINVIGRLRGSSERLVLAGNHRDAWVRGANDAGGGTVALLRAAAHLEERVRAGWQPPSTIGLAFWDAEEHGLIGSTEWGEANGAWLQSNLIAYVNADTAVSGTRLSAVAGSPGLLGSLRAALERVEAAPGEGPRANLWQEWSGASGGAPRLELPGSGSDFAVFLHHLNLPVLDFGLGGSRGGQYHTAFDDFAFVEQHIDPGFVGHEIAGRLHAELLRELAQRGPQALDRREAADEFARRARECADWLGAERAEQLAKAFEACDGRRNFYLTLADPRGVPGRTWFRNRLWSSELENGYGSELFPTLRHARQQGEAALDAELANLLAALSKLQDKSD
jgi:N-acetylated-alpha-linked acidic dipeptidase